MLYAGRMLYVDFHPGNFLFMDDGRLGVIDFGFMLEIDDTLWELFRKIDRPLTTGRRDDRIAAIKEWSWISDDPADEDRLRLGDEYADWSWRARYCGGEFDFGDEADFRRGVDLFVRNGPQALHPRPPLHLQSICRQCVRLALDASTGSRPSIDIAANRRRRSPRHRLGPQRLRTGKVISRQIFTGSLGYSAR